MAENELDEASEQLRKASESAANDDLRERLSDRSDALADLAAKERKPDHGRLAREDGILRDVADAADGDVRERVETAREKIAEFREGVEGV